jgi:hypothetical protein
MAMPQGIPSVESRNASIRSTPFAAPVLLRIDPLQPAGVRQLLAGDPPVGGQLEEGDAGGRERSRGVHDPVDHRTFSSVTTAPRPRCRRPLPFSAERRSRSAQLTIVPHSDGRNFDRLTPVRDVTGRAENSQSSIAAAGVRRSPQRQSAATRTLLGANGPEDLTSQGRPPRQERSRRQRIAGRRGSGSTRIFLALGILAWFKPR